MESDTRKSERIKLLTGDSRTMSYELYTTMEEEEQLMLATVEKEIPEEDKEDEEVLAAVEHFIMVHYEEKE